ESLITSKTRIKLMLKFFLNSSTKAYLRGLEAEFGESTNAIRLELNRFEQAGLLTSFSEGNRKFFSANTTHPLFPDIQSLMRKHLGIDQLVEQVIEKLGEVEKVYLTGAFAHGKESTDIEILLVGGDVDTAYLEKLIIKAGKLIKRNILYQLMPTLQFDSYFASQGKENLLLLWEQNN
ncbi:MAG: ArsR family transcriptional regulator, partial [Bacteroidales bacterium]|nr:ArsR family transcriptional regulator [Bacteroidales bacterium]